MAVTEDEGFERSKRTVAAATVSAGKQVATSHRFSSFDGSAQFAMDPAMNPLFRPNDDDVP